MNAELGYSKVWSYRTVKFWCKGDEKLTVYSAAGMTYRKLASPFMNSEA